jgi:hypothetical protein
LWGKLANNEKGGGIRVCPLKWSVMSIRSIMSIMSIRSERSIECIKSEKSKCPEVENVCNVYSIERSVDVISMLCGACDYL